MTWTLVLGLLRGRWKYALWTAGGLWLSWILNLVAPRDATYGVAVYLVFMTLWAAPMTVTTLCASDKTSFVLPLSRRQLGRTVWLLGATLPSAIAVAALIGGAAFAHRLGRINVLDWPWIAFVSLAQSAFSGAAMSLMTFRSWRAVKWWPTFHALGLLAGMIVAPLIVSHWLPTSSVEISFGDWVAVLCALALTVWGWLRVDALAVFQGSIADRARVSRETARAGPIAVRHASATPSRFAPLWRRLCMDLAAAFTIGLLLPVGVALMNRMLEGYAVSLTDSMRSFATTNIWTNDVRFALPMIALAIWGFFGSDSRWWNYRRLRALPIARREWSLFLIARAAAPLIGLWMAFAALNLLIVGTVPPWLGANIFLGACGAAALLAAFGGMWATRHSARPPSSGYNNPSGSMIVLIALMGPLTRIAFAVAGRLHFRAESIAGAAGVLTLCVASYLNWRALEHAGPKAPKAVSMRQ
jgi:hypothetical protein